MNTIRTPDEILAESEATEAPIGADEASSIGRLHFWHVALLMANARPLLGVGLNAFNVAYDQYDDQPGTFGGSRSVHSAWFGVLAELGYPGLLLFVAQIALAFGACRRARRASKLGDQYADLSRFAFALEAALIAFIIGGSFLPFQYTEMLWHFFGLTIALDLIARTALASSVAVMEAQPGGLAPAFASAVGLDAQATTAHG
jgi:O-antigen ligase